VAGLYDDTPGLSDGTGLWRGRLGLFSGASGLINGSGGAYIDLYFSAGTYSVAGNGYSTLTSVAGFTFTRASLAMGYDATGKLTYGPNNLLLQSQTFDNGSWNKISGGTGSAPVVTANQAIAPDGTMTADLAVFTLNGGTASGDNSSLTQSVTPPAPNITSLWAMTSDGSTKVFSLLGVGGTLQTITITGTWQRFFVLETGVAAAAVRLRLRGSASGEGTATSASIYLWGAQVEAVTYQTTPSTYYPTTSAAYYGPRLVYDPVTLASLGILVEEARTNLCLQSQTFDNASWTKNASSIAADATTSPDGTSNADKLVEAATTAVHGVQQSFTLSAIAYTYSVYIKAAGRSWAQLVNGAIGNGYAYFNVSTGATGILGAGFTSSSIQDVGNGWYRCSVVFTGFAGGNITEIRAASANGTASYAGDGTFGLYLWQAQLELGQGASSPIPTTTAAVTRAAEIAYTSGLATLPEFTVVAEGIPNSPDTMPGVQTLAGYDDGTATNRVYAFRGITSQANLATSTGYAYSGANWPQGADRKIAFTSKTGAQTGAFNGTLATPGTSAQPANLSSLSIGVRSDRSTLQWNGTISRIRIYNRALTDAQLQAITQSLLLQEDGYSILQEDNSYIWLE